MLSVFSWWNYKDQILQSPGKNTGSADTARVPGHLERYYLPLDLMSISEPRGAVKSKPEWNSSLLVPHSHHSHPLLHHPCRSEPQRSLQLDPKLLPWRITPHLSPSWMTSKEVPSWASPWGQAQGPQGAHKAPYTVVSPDSRAAGGWHLSRTLFDKNESRAVT